MPLLDVSNDFFIRTTDEGHKVRVQEVLQRVHDNGHVYKGTYEGWYCPRCADFKTGNEIGARRHLPDPRDPADSARRRTTGSSGSRASRTTSSASSREQPGLRACRASATTRRSRSSPAGSATCRCRARSSPGASPVPWDPEHVFYVWFDALLNYYTALGYARDGQDLTDEFWPATFHIIGKDILKFHTVFWPAMLLAAGIPLPEHVFVHGFLLMRDASGRDFKMSKSLGNVLDPFADHRAVRHRRPALLLPARGLLRAGRRGLDGGLRGALRGRAGQRAGQPREPHHVDGGALPRRHGPGRASSTRTSSPSSRPSPGGRGAARQRRAHGRAGGRMARRAAAEPLRRGAGALEPREGGRGRGGSPRVLATLVEGLRVVAVLLHPWMPAARRRRSCDALGAPDLDYAGATPAGGTVRTRRAPRAAVPQARGVGMIDSPHPSGVARSRATMSWSAPRREAGVTRMLTVGIDAESCRQALDAARALRGRVGRDRPPPQRGDGLHRRRPRRAARARAAPALRGDRRDRAGLLPRGRAAGGPGARVPGADRARARDRPSRSSSTPATPRTRRSTCCPPTRTAST